jgi:hypothetical protein
MKKLSRRNLMQEVALLGLGSGSVMQALTQPLRAQDFAGWRKELTGFLEDTREIRLKLYQSKTEPGRDEEFAVAKVLESQALKWFEKKALAGHRREQFYLGEVYYQVYAITQDKAHLDAALKLFGDAAAKGHPDATHRLIRRMPTLENAGQYRKSIQLGSVSALAACSLALADERQGRDWMKVGPNLAFPEQAGAGSWSEVFTHWMIIYHFLARWDRKGEHLTLSFPNQGLLEIITGVIKPEKGYEEPFGLGFMQECIEKAAQHARTMDLDFLPEEIYDKAWNALFRP